MQERRRLLHSVLVDFRLCHNLSTLEQVKGLAHLLAEEGFYPSPAKGGEPVYKAPDIDALVDERYTVLDPNVKGLAGLLRRVDFQLLVKEFPTSDTWCACGWSVFKGERVNFGIVGGVWAYPEEQKMYQEPFAQCMLALAQKLYPVIQPAYVSITDSDVDSHPMDDSQAAKLKITTLSWVNLFSADFVERYGRSTLANIPGYHVHDLPDGGIFYQSRPSIFVENKIEHKRWQKDATTYLANHGLRLNFRSYL